MIWPCQKESRIRSSSNLWFSGVFHLAVSGRVKKKTQTPESEWDVHQQVLMKMTSLVKVHHDLTRPKNPEKSSWAFEKSPKVFMDIKVGEMIKHHHLARWLLDCSSSCPIAGQRSRCLTLNVFWPSEPPSRPWHRSWDAAVGTGKWQFMASPETCEEMGNSHSSLQCILKIQCLSQTLKLWY